MCSLQMGSTYYIIDAFINATYKSFVRVNKALSYRPFLCSISPVVSFEFGSLDFFFNNRILTSVHEYLSALTFTIATLTANYLKTIRLTRILRVSLYFVSRILKYNTCLKWHNNEFMRKLKVKLWIVKSKLSIICERRLVL